MALYKILHFPDSRLRHMALPITDPSTKEIQTLIDDMFETMYDANGVGLAATQIGINLRLAVIDVSRDHSQPLVLINPEIIASEGRESMQEGCLSVPGHWDTVYRASHVTLRAQDRQGKIYELPADGVLAECIQHEIDHLNGGLYIDMLSKLKQDRIKKKLEKHRRSCNSCA